MRHLSEKYICCTYNRLAICRKFYSTISSIYYFVLICELVVMIVKFFQNLNFKGVACLFLLIQVQKRNSGYPSNPALFNNASTFGSAPLNLLYSSMGFSVPPLESTLSLNFLATSLLKIPFSLK